MFIFTLNIKQFVVVHCQALKEFELLHSCGVIQTELLPINISLRSKTREQQVLLNSGVKVQRGHNTSTLSSSSLRV